MENENVLQIDGLQKNLRKQMRISFQKKEKNSLQVFLCRNLSV